VFIEPLVESSRPDIVVVFWDPSVTSTWPSERHALKKADLRLAHLLHLSGPLREEQIRQVFPTGLVQSLERLSRAGLATDADGLWALRNLKEIFAVRRIVAFEAKVSSLSRALVQAHLNTWFASESYVIAASRRPTMGIMEKARRLGVGLWARSDTGNPVRVLSAEAQETPMSYASWFFNELTWEASLRASDEH
jgi:hypothetical protein